MSKRKGSSSRTPAPAAGAGAGADVPAGLPLLLDRLTRALGPDHVDTTSAPPHIRCAPGSPHEVSEVLEGAALAGVHVSLDGAPAALLHLSLRRLADVLSVDEVSQVCEVQAGVTLLALEDALRPRGLTLGPLPAPTWERTLGAVLAAPRPAEAALSVGRLRDRALRVYGVLAEVGARREIALPVSLSPRRAAGPDLKQALIGGGGRTGVITSASVVALRVPALSRCIGWLCPDTAAAMAAVTAIARRHGGGVGPADVQVLSRVLVARLAPDLALPGGEAAVLLRAAGAPGLAEAEVQAAAGICAASGAHELPEALAQEWLAPGRLGAHASLWPAHGRALPPCSAAELTAEFDRTAGARVLCGVHLLGAAIYGEAKVPAAAKDEGAARLLSALMTNLDPRRLLCRGRDDA